MAHLFRLRFSLPPQKRPHRVNTDPQPLRYFLCGAALGGQSQHLFVNLLCIVDPVCSGRGTKTVAVGTAVQKANHQILLWRDHHFEYQNADHQSIDLDIKFSLSDILQNGPRLCRNGSERLPQQIRTVGDNVFVCLQQVLHRVADSGIQFLGINVTATALGMPGFLVIALPDSVPVGCGMPCFSPIPTAAVSAEDFVSEGRESAVPVTGIRPFDLRFLPYGLADDTGMPVLYIVLRRFTLIRLAGFRQEINGNLFLQDRISHVFFVFQNAANGFDSQTLLSPGEEILYSIRMRQISVLLFSAKASR